ncbi:MAG: efflux RND transporter periplasmic adaptor subunit [Candidatus Korobacteraceae bacterium]
MTAREKRIAAFSVLTGVLLAGLIYLGGGLLVGFWQVSPAMPPAAADASASSMDLAEKPMESSALRSVQLTDGEQRSIDLQTVPVGRQRLQHEILTVGRVEEAEPQIANISARTGGRIDELMVNFVGQEVRPGQAIARIYSPEIVASAEEYRLALDNQKRLGTAAEAQAISQANDLVAASRRRLELWGLTPEQIRGLGVSSGSDVHITIVAEIGGTVTDRKVTQGQYVREGDVLFSITDLSTVWVIADVYEADVPFARLGQTVQLTSEALPGVTLAGRVSFLEPRVNEQTRTLPIRIEVVNPGMRLRPGMYVNIKLRSADPSPTLTVPRSAVLGSGLRNIVYVEVAEGLFEGREVTLGPADDKSYPIIAGLREGERVVSKGAFMIDSQSRITGGMTGLFSGSKEFERETEPPNSPTERVRFSFRTDPDPPKGASQNTFHVSVIDQSGKPIPDAQVSVTLVMPAMPSMNMPEMRSSSALTWNGFEYATKANISMAGPWNVTVEASRGGTVLGTHRIRLNAR